MSYGRVAFASFCAYALAHNLGFAAVSGAAVRYRLYAHWGLTPLQIAKTVAFCTLTFGLGGMVLGGTILLLEPTTIPFFGEHLPAIALRGVGLAAVGVVVCYLTVVVRPGLGPIARPPDRAAEMAHGDAAGGSGDRGRRGHRHHLLSCCCRARPASTWTIFLGVYVASYTAGLAANLPGGIGVFDTAMLFGLEVLCRRAAHRRRHPGVPAVLLRHSAVPGRLPVRRQRDPAARRRPVAGRHRTRVGAAGHALERARLHRRRRHRRWSRCAAPCC